MTKLDFPAPDGPRSRIPALVTEASMGFHLLIAFMYSVLFLQKQALPPSRVKSTFVYHIVEEKTPLMSRICWNHLKRETHLFPQTTFLQGSMSGQERRRSVKAPFLVPRTKSGTFRLVVVYLVPEPSLMILESRSREAKCDPGSESKTDLLLKSYT